MRFMAIHFDKHKQVDKAILTDDYTEEEVSLGKHILNLKRDMKKEHIDALHIFDENDKLVAIVY